MTRIFKPYKDKRFSIAVFDYGEYSYRENLSSITPNELLKFLESHNLVNTKRIQELEARLEIAREALEVIEMISREYDSDETLDGFYFAELAKKFLEKIGKNMER